MTSHIDLLTTLRYGQPMTSPAPDYSYVVEEPPAPARPSPAPSMIPENLERALRDGKSARIATYPGKSSASTVASELRRGVRKLPAGTTPDQWEIISGRVKRFDEFGEELPKAAGDMYGVWARFLG